jgi:predicted dehydrogenase
MNKRIRWGILGYARIARAQLIPAILKDRNSEFYAIASRGTEQLAQCRSTFSPQKCYQSYDALLDDPDVDAVYIPLPNSMHHKWTLKACARKKHVLCEKPIAMNTAECREMIEAARHHGVILMEAFMYRYTDRIQKVKTVLESGRLGHLKYVYAAWRFFLNRENTIKEDGALGGGSLFDVGPYPVNFLSLITPSTAVSVSAEAVMAGEVDVLFAGTITYPDGLVAQISSGFNAFTRTHAEIIGDKGVLIVEDPFSGDPGELILQIDSGEERIAVAASDRYALEVAHFTSALLGAGGNLLSLDESLHNTELLERLSKAAQRH